MRRITGYVLSGLGFLLLADIIFFLIYRERRYGPEDWLRFYVILWVGLSLSATGWWLARKSRVALWGVLLIFVAGMASCLASQPADHSVGTSSRTAD
jgi:hypothetical protein